MRRRSRHSLFHWETWCDMRRKCCPRATRYSFARFQPAVLPSSRFGQRRHWSQILFRRSGRSHWAGPVGRWLFDGSLCCRSQSICFALHCLPYETHGNDSARSFRPCSTSKVGFESKYKCSQMCICWHIKRYEIHIRLLSLTLNLTSKKPSKFISTSLYYISCRHH